MKDFHKKPLPEERSVEESMKRAEWLGSVLPKANQVHAADWDIVILADEIKRLRGMIDIP